MRRTSVVIAAALLLPFPVAAQQASDFMATRVVLQRGQHVLLHFAEPRPVTVLDGFRPARFNATGRQMPVFGARRLSGRVREVRGDTLTLVVSRIDTVGGRWDVYLRRGLRAHVVADSTVTLEPLAPPQAGNLVGALAIGLLVGAVLVIGALGNALSNPTVN